MKETRGVIQYNRGTKCIVRSIVCMYSLRKWWDGPVTMVLEGDYPKSYENVIKGFNIDIIHSENPDTGVMVRSVEICKDLAPYDRNLWLDTDTVVVGKIDEMFDYLDDCEVSIPHFADWWSDGSGIAKRVKRYSGLASDKVIKTALSHHPAINCGVFSFRKDATFLDDWLSLASKGDHKMFIPDEVAFQTLYPSFPEKVKVCPSKFNVSVLHDRGRTKDKRIIHYHGQKHVLNVPYCRVWKDLFHKMRRDNTAGINNYIYLSDKRLKEYIDDNDNDLTVVTACDEKYIECLKLTFPNWRKYKNIDKYPVIVFVNGIELDDSRLDFLRLDNVELIPWSMDNVDSHREEMLSAFILGTAKHVKTNYWLKLDADSFATDYSPIVDDSMKDFVFCGHKWGYSWAEHIKKLDEWSKNHGKRQIRNAKPMYDPSRVKGRRFYHDKKRTISFVQLQQTRFTRWCAKMAGWKRLPVPSHDTYMFYIADRFENQYLTKNFKKFHGFDQGKGSDIESIKRKIKEVDEKNVVKQIADFVENHLDFDSSEEFKESFLSEDNIVVGNEEIKEENLEKHQDIQDINSECAEDEENANEPENLIGGMSLEFKQSCTLKDDFKEKCGVIMYNYGTEYMIRSLVSLISLKKWWDGNITVFVENSPDEYFNCLNELGVNIQKIEDSKEDDIRLKKIEICSRTPYENTLWVDADTLVCGDINEMFAYLGAGCDMVLTEYGYSPIGSMKIAMKRNSYFNEISSDKHKDKIINTAIDSSAVRGGVLSFKNKQEIFEDWMSFSKSGFEKNIYHFDEVGLQLLSNIYGSICKVSCKFNYQVNKLSIPQDDIRILHYQRSRHLMNTGHCRCWKIIFEDMLKENVANIKSLAKFSDKMLKDYIVNINKDITVVSGCNKESLNRLVLTFPNWIKYKRIDRYPILIFVKDVSLDDERLKVFDLPNVQVVQYGDGTGINNAYLDGVSKYVKTDYWLKMSPSSYAVNDKEIVNEEMKDYCFYGHRWKNSVAGHIIKLDEWAKSCKCSKIRNSEPMFDGKNLIKGVKYQHERYRTNSFVQMNSTKFTKFCNKLCEGKMRFASEDTFMFYVCDRLNYPFKAVDLKEETGMYNSVDINKLAFKLKELEKNESV